ncbi:hypothetical protein ACH5RR_022778 [Cinchona calisaya]|uniref:Transposase n=1 Tax=Cinchona calisaya TaxID=153742 RepID=A0ABD2ZAM2_9GENT
MFSATLFRGINNASSVLPYVSTKRVVFYREISEMNASLAYALGRQKDDENNNGTSIHDPYSMNATAGRDLSIVLGIKEIGHEEQGIEEPEQHEPHEAGQKHKHVKATDACDVNIFHGEQIQVNEESEFLNSYELNSIYSSLDEEVRPTSRFVLFRPETDMNDPNLYVGLQFSSKNEFKEAVENHAVKWGKEFRWKKNDSIKMRAVCQANNCSWFVFVSKMADSDIFVIKTMGPPHQCGRNFYHKRVTSTLLSKTYVEFLRLNRKVTVGEFQEKVHRELNANITRHQVYTTFQKAKILIYGKYKKQYSKIWDYYEELLKKIPGSTVDIVIAVDEISGKERFQRMYICFEALKMGFREGCRPVVGVDGCHLRGPYPGILLTAVGIDPNDCIYPIAYVVVEIENKNSWRWFIEHLKYDLGIYDQQSWTFISDRQKGLGSAIHEILPRIEHRHCVRHLHNNFKKLHPGDSLKARVWACARAYEPVIEPIHGPNAWPNSKKDPIHAPKKLKLPGRPKKARRTAECCPEKCKILSRKLQNSVQKTAE